MDKCTLNAKRDGAKSLCKKLSESIVRVSKDLQPVQVLKIRKGFEGESLHVLMVFGEHREDRLRINYCPFCGGKLRDTSKDGE